MSETETTEVWSVALAADNIATMTLDQLDVAYQAGQISEQTLIWTEGMDAWLPLAEVIGGDDEEEAPVAEVAPPVAHFAPAAVAAAPVAVAPVAVAPVAAAPVAVQPQAPQAAAAMQSAPYQSAPYQTIPQPMAAAPSTAPMALNMPEPDYGMDDFQPKKKSKLGLLAAAAVLLGGVGFTVANLGGEADSSAAAAAPVAAAPAGGEALALVQKNDPNAPLALGGYEVSDKEKEAIRKETEEAAEQREKMAAALGGDEATEKEKAKAAKGAMKKRYGGAPKAKKSAGGGGSALSKGGNSFDPLNASLP